MEKGINLDEKETEEKEIIDFTIEEQNYLKTLENVKLDLEERKNKLIKIKETKITKPQKVKEAFLKEDRKVKNIWDKIRNKPIPIQKELQEPLLLIMKENGYTDIIEGVKAGDFKIQTQKTMKTINLSPEKLQTLKYGEQYYKCWIAYENCATPYPENPIHTAEMYQKTTQKLSMNWRDRDDTTIITAKTKMWLYIIAAVIIGLVLLFSTPVGKQIIDGIGKEAVAVAVTTVKVNTTKEELKETTETNKQIQIT